MSETRPFPKRILFIPEFPTFYRDWVENVGHSYHQENGCPHVRFACRFCNKDITDMLPKHCWDCMSKYCDACWTLHQYGFDKMLIGDGCPRDAPHQLKSKSSF